MPPIGLGYVAILGLFDSWTSAGEHAEEADDALATVASVGGCELRSPPTVTTVAEVNEHAETGEPILVPVVTCDLEVEDEPRLEDIFRYVADVCERLQRIYADAHVRQFDVRFEFGPDRFLRSRECRRVTVPPEMVNNLSDAGYGARELGADLEAADDGDSVTPPVVWGECVSYTSGGDTAAYTGAMGAGGW